MKWTIAFDPGKSTGLSLWYGTQLVGYALCKDGHSFTALRNTVYSLVAEVEEGEHKMVLQGGTAVIEDGYIGFNRRTAQITDRARGICQSVAEHFGLEFHYVMPGTWHFLLKDTLKGLFPKHKGKWKREHLKPAAKKKAGEIVGRAIVSEDVADAICQGRFWVAKP